MSKPIVYGTIMSPPVRAVLLTANAIALDIEFKEMDMTAGEHLSEEFLKKNPQHTVPMLEDGGEYVWDSHAIATYLIDKYGKDQFLYPKDLYKRALVDQRLHFDSGILFPTMRKLVTIFRQNKTGLSQEDKDITTEPYDFLEKFLATDLYLVGNCLTVADLCCAATITTLELLAPIDPTKYPKVTEWVQRISLLPYYQKANGEGIKKVIAFAANLHHAGSDAK